MFIYKIEFNDVEEVHYRILTHEEKFSNEELADIINPVIVDNLKKEHLRNLENMKSEEFIERKKRFCDKYKYKFNLEYFIDSQPLCISWVVDEVFSDLINKHGFKELIFDATYNEYCGYDIRGPKSEDYPTSNNIDSILKEFQKEFGVSKKIILEKIKED